MLSCAQMRWPPRLVTVPGLHGSDGAHWQTWLERQFARSLRVEQDDWDAPDLAVWSAALARRLAGERGPFLLAAHSFGCLVAAHALSTGMLGQSGGSANGARGGKGTAGADIAGVLFVAPASPEKFRFAGVFEAQRLSVPSILIGSETDPWMPLEGARTLAQQLGSTFVNLGDAGHINTAAGFGPWPRAKYFVDTLVRGAAPQRLRDEAFDEVGQAVAGDGAAATRDGVVASPALTVSRWSCAPAPTAFAPTFVDAGQGAKLAGR